MRRFLAIAFAICFAPVPAATQESAAPEIRGAEVRISAKKWDDAQRFLEEDAIPKFPESAELHYWLGVVYAQGSNRDTEKAAQAFAKASELADPEDRELETRIDTAVKAIWGPLVNAAAKAADADDFAEAETLLKKATEINPQGPEGWINLGTVYLRQKKHAEAVEAYRKALELQPENETVAYNLGITYHTLARDAAAAGDSVAAAEHYTQAEATYKAYLATHPEDAEIINSLAALYQERGDEGKMRATLGDMAQADSAGQEDFYNAGRAFLKGNDYAKAEEALTKTISLEDASDEASREMTGYAMEYLGLALIQQKKYEQAIDVLRKLVDRAPQSATAHEYLGYAYRDAGRREEATAAFSKAEELKGQGGGTTSSSQ